MATYKFCDGNGNTISTEVSMTQSGYYAYSYSSTESETSGHKTDLFFTADKTVSERLKINYTYQVRTSHDNGSTWTSWHTVDAATYIEAGNDSVTVRVKLDEHVCYLDSGND